MPTPLEPPPPPPTNYLVHCATCNPKVGYGWWLGTMKPMQHFHEQSGTLHTLSVVAMTDDEQIAEGESFQDFLKRMMTKYVP